MAITAPWIGRLFNVDRGVAKYYLRIAVGEGKIVKIKCGRFIWYIHPMQYKQFLNRYDDIGLVLTMVEIKKK